MRPLFSILCLGSCLTCATGLALEWQATRLELRADPCAVETVALFECSNPLARPVRIKSIATRCGCTVARAESREIAAGGATSILVVFAHEGRQGPQLKTIEVTSDDGEKPKRLFLSVDLPVVLTMRPQFLRWRGDEDPDWKTVAIETAEDACFEIDAVEVGRGDFAAEFAATRDGYEIRVRPTRPKPQSGVVEIQVQSKTGSERRTFQLILASGLDLGPSAP